MGYVRRDIRVSVCHNVQIGRATHVAPYMCGMMRDIIPAQNISLKIYLSNCNYNNSIQAPSDLHHPLIIPSSIMSSCRIR